MNTDKKSALIKAFNELNVKIHITHEGDAIDILYDLFVIKKVYPYHISDLKCWNYLALYYEIIEKNYKEAERYYFMAVKNNDSRAMINLALYYIKHYKDYQKAKRWYITAINLNNDIAMINLAIHYHMVEYNYAEAKRYYLMAVKAGNPIAMNNLAILYQSLKNREKIIYYYLMAIKLGCSDSMYNLAIYYDYDEHNYAEAKRYYLMAVEHNHSKAMFYLGNYYEYIEKDCIQANKYYLLAANNGEKKSVKHINQILKTSFDIKLAHEAYVHLDEENKHSLNYEIIKTIKIATYLKRAPDIHNIYFKIECTVCKVRSKCVFMSCGHTVCACCYERIIECPICNKV